MAPGVEIRVSVENDSIQMSVKASGKNSKFKIRQLNGETFVSPGGNAIIFSDIKNGFSQKFTFTTKNEEKIFKRLKEIDMSKVDLNEYAGEYLNDSFIDTKYALYVENDTLKAKVKDNEPIVLYMHDIDQFYAENIFCQFNRTNGKITEAILDADRVKNLKFVKLK